MIRRLTAVPFFGALVVYHCDGCRRWKPGWEERRPRRWAVHLLHRDELDPEAGTVLHECRSCRRAWPVVRRSIVRERRLKSAGDGGAAG